MELYHHEFKAMGSPCDIRIYAHAPNQASQAIKKATHAIEKLEDKYSRYKPNNELYRINQVAAQGGSINIDEEFTSLLNYADACYQQSNGLFDITSGVLRQIWNFSTPSTITLPNTQQINTLLNRVGWHHVTFDNHQLNFAHTGMEIDLGGIVKEYAADLAANVLQQEGIVHGLVNLGGDIKAIGPHPDGTPWVIKIRDPKKTSEHITEMLLFNEGLATSGDYERCIKINGKNYSHILSPKNGWPVSGLASVTVKAPQCIVAGSAATIAMLKEHKGRQWLQTLQLEFTAIDIEQEI